MRFLTNLDLTGLQLLNARIQQLATAPGSPTEGLIYHNTTDHVTYVWNGSAWVSMLFSVEDAQDAVGGILVDGTTIDFTYNDSTPSVTAEVKAGAIGTTQLADNGVTDARLADMVQYRVKGRIASGSGDPTDLTGDNVMDVITSGGTVDISAKSRKITNVADPASAQDAATKAYVDSVAQGLDVKPSVKAATTANITLSATQTIDGVALVAGDRVLVKNQSSASQNGIYVAAAGAWARASDADTWAELVSAFVFVEQGTSNADTGWTCTVDSGGTLSTTDVTWSQFSGAGSVVLANVGTGTGVYKGKTGNTYNLYSIKAGSSKIAVSLVSDDITVDVTEANLTLGNLGGTLTVAKGGTGATDAVTARSNLGAVGKYAGNVGNNSATTITVTHNLNTLDVTASVRDASTGAFVWSDVTVVDANTISLGFAGAPTTNQYRVVVTG